MSTWVKGFIAPDEEYAKKVTAWRACRAAGVEPPRELERFFNGEEPQDAGMEVDVSAAVSKVRPHDSAEGYDVDITKLPKGVRVVRFYNSW